MYSEELASKERMKESLQQAFIDSKPIFAEGEALIYLSESFEKGQQSLQMTGLLQGKSCSTDQVNHFGYSSFILNHDMFFQKQEKKSEGMNVTCLIFDQKKKLPVSLEISPCCILEYFKHLMWLKLLLGLSAKGYKIVLKWERGDNLSCFPFKTAERQLSQVLGERNIIDIVFGYNS